MIGPSWTSREARVIVPPRRDDMAVDRLDDEVSVTDPQTGNLYQLNPTAFAVWTRCDGKTTTRQIAKQLADSYDVDFDAALEDVEQLVSLFGQSGLLSNPGKG